MDADNYGSSEKLIAHIKERADDIDHVLFVTSQGLKRTQPDGSVRLTMGVGAVLCYCDGQHSLIHKTDATLLVNDGILGRMRIKVRYLNDGDQFQT